MLKLHIKQASVVLLCLRLNCYLYIFFVSFLFSALLCVLLLCIRNLNSIDILTIVDYRPIPLNNTVSNQTWPGYSNLTIT